jgi:hypothetical protein
MREEVTVKGINGTCYLIGFTEGPKNYPLVESPKHTVPIAVDFDRLPDFVVIDAWELKKGRVKKIRVNLRGLGFKYNHYFYTKKGALEARDKQEHQITIDQLKEKTSFVFNNKLYKKEKKWIVHTLNERKMWIKSKGKDALLSLLNTKSDLKLTLTYTGVQIDE